MTFGICRHPSSLSPYRLVIPYPLLCIPPLSLVREQEREKAGQSTMCINPA